MVRASKMVEVAFLTPQKQVILQLKVALNACVKDVILQSGFLAQFPELRFEADKFSHDVSIFSQKCTLNTFVNEGDRVEILRPLTLSALEARQLRASRQSKKNSACATK